MGPDEADPAVRTLHRFAFHHFDRALGARTYEIKLNGDHRVYNVCVGNNADGKELMRVAWMLMGIGRGGESRNVLWYKRRYVEPNQKLREQNVTNDCTLEMNATGPAGAWHASWSVRAERSTGDRLLVHHARVLPLNRARAVSGADRA